MRAHERGCECAVFKMMLRVCMRDRFPTKAYPQSRTDAPTDPIKHNASMPHLFDAEFRCPDEILKKSISIFPDTYAFVIANQVKVLPDDIEYPRCAFLELARIRCKFLLD